MNIEGCKKHFSLKSQSTFLTFASVSPYSGANVSAEESSSSEEPKKPKFNFTPLGKNSFSTVKKGIQIKLSSQVNIFYLHYSSLTF